MPNKPAKTAAKANSSKTSAKAPASKAPASKSAPSRTAPKTVAKAPVIKAPVNKLVPQKPAAAAPRVEEPKKPLTQRQGFRTNEFVVYPAHGVGQILAIEEQEIAGAKRSTVCHGRSPSCSM